MNSILALVIVLSTIFGSTGPAVESSKWNCHTVPAIRGNGTQEVCVFISPFAFEEQMAAGKITHLECESGELTPRINGNPDGCQFDPFGSNSSLPLSLDKRFPGPKAIGLKDPIHP